MSKNIYTHPMSAKGPTYVHAATGMRLVQPGETVHLQVVTAAAESAVSTPAGSSLLAELQGKSISEIEKSLSDLDKAALGDLRKLEQDSKKPRSTLLQKIDEQILKLDAGTGPTIDEKKAQLAAASAEQIASNLTDAPVEVLTEVLDLESAADQPRTDVIEFLQAEIAKRNEQA